MIASDDPAFAKGDFVWAVADWEEYNIIQTPVIFKIDVSINVPLSYYIGILGEYINVETYKKNIMLWAQFS